MTRGILWGQLDQERLTATSSEDALEELLDTYDTDQQPAQVTVHEFAQLEVNVSRLAEVALGCALEWLDDKFGDPEDHTGPTKGMQIAAGAFADILVAHYSVWRYEPTGKSVTVNAQEWIDQHWPEKEPVFTAGRLYQAVDVGVDLGLEKGQTAFCTVVKKADGQIEILAEGILDED